MLIRSCRSESERIRLLILDQGADLPEFGEESDVDGFAKEGDSGASAGAGFETDDTFDGEHMAESPEADLFFDIDELFGHFVG